MTITNVVSKVSVLFLALPFALAASAQNMPRPEASSVAATAPPDMSGATLPGDRVSGARAPGGAGPRQGPPVQEPPGPGPSLALALEAAQEAIAACAKDGLKVGVSVLDASGQPRAMLTGDGTTGSHVYTGVRKALAALAFKLPGSQIAAKIEADPSAAASVKPNMRVMAGSVPLMVGSRVVGAIGVSGASSQQDEQCASAGAEKIRARLQ